VNRPLLVRALSVFNRLSGTRSRFASRHKGAIGRSRRASFELCEDRNLLSGVSISGIKFATAHPSGFSPGDTPLGGVFIDLYKDNGDSVFNPGSDTLVDRQQTAAVTGAYTFANVADGHYFIQEEVPAGYFQSAGPPFYTVDVVGGKVGTLVDSFSDPSSADSFFITALNANPFTPPPYFGPGILGGERDLVVNVLNTPNPISANGFIGGGVSNGVFNLGTATNGPGTEVTMHYDGAGLPASLTGNGTNTGIELDFDFLQVGTGTTMNLQIDASSPGGGTATLNENITQNPTGFSLFVPFSSFTTTGSFNFANVNDLKFTYNQTGVQDVDFQLNQIVAANPTSSGYNFGNFPITVSSISGLKYVDSNNNANHDPGEPPIGGVIITLSGTDNLGHAVNLQTQTAADGTFKFSNLQPGTYLLIETPPINFIIGQPKLGSQGGTITSPTVISHIVLPVSTDAVDYEFGELGFTPPYASKRSLLFPPQPVVLTAVYSTTPTGSNSVTTAAKPAVATTTVKPAVVTPAAIVVTPAAKVVAPAKKPALKPAPKPAPKVPLVIPIKKKTK
jgi:hypothetical protein